MIIFNLTRHKATPSQQQGGVIDLPDELISKINQLSIFQPVPSESLLITRANMICELLSEHAKAYPGVNAVMCGGAPYFNVILDKALKSYGFSPCYPFTQREVERSLIGGQKANIIVYNHMGVVFT